MKTLKLYVICYKTFGSSETETDIAFINEIDAIQYVAKMNKKANCYFYKKVSKTCYLSLAEYNQNQANNSKSL